MQTTEQLKAEPVLEHLQACLKNRDKKNLILGPCQKVLGGEKKILSPNSSQKLVVKNFNFCQFVGPAL
jgi:hypothetical protein